MKKEIDIIKIYEIHSGVERYVYKKDWENLDKFVNLYYKEDNTMSHARYSKVSFTEDKSKCFPKFKIIIDYSIKYKGTVILGALDEDSAIKIIKKRLDQEYHKCVFQNVDVLQQGIEKIKVKKIGTKKGEIKNV